jgi:hypothetical protein
MINHFVIQIRDNSQTDETHKIMTVPNEERGPKAESVAPSPYATTGALLVMSLSKDATIRCNRGSGAISATAIQN